MLITTRKGDGGRSSYFEKKVSKGGIFLETIGSLDELQAVMQLVSYELRVTSLEKISNDLYLIMGCLGREARNEKIETRIKEMEKAIEKLENEVKIKREFVIFKNEKAIKLNWLRTVARRTERAVVRLKESGEKINSDVIIYLNRLSDFIYLLVLQKDNG